MISPPRCSSSTGSRSAPGRGRASWPFPRRPETTRSLEPAVEDACDLDDAGQSSGSSGIPCSFARSLLFYYCRTQHLHLGFFFRVTCSTCEASPGPCAVILVTSTVAALDAATCAFNNTPLLLGPSHFASILLDTRDPSRRNTPGRSVFRTRESTLGSSKCTLRNSNAAPLKR